MSEKYRFPSGITIDQARKNAKRRAKELNISLSSAQDIIAKECGANTPWREAIRTLNKSDRRQFKFTFNDKQIELASNKPVCLVSGIPGSGKSIASLMLLGEYLNNGGQAHILADGLASRNSHLFALDAASEYADELCSRYKSRITIDCIKQKGKTITHHYHTSQNISKGTLVLIDELYSISRDVNVPALAEALLDRDCRLILVVQHYDDLLHCGFDLQWLENSVGMLVFGRQSTHSIPPGYDGVIETINPMLVVKDRVFADLFVSHDELAFNDIVRFQFPLTSVMESPSET